MIRADAPRVYSIPFGVPFLPRLAEALCRGELIPDFRVGEDPLALADVTIYVPTRRAARELRTVFIEQLQTSSAILPDIRPLGDIDEDGTLFSGGSPLEILPAIDPLDRLLNLAPLVRAWKARLPAHVADMFDKPVTVPVTNADAIWLARDVAALMDEVELEGAEWAKLPELAENDLAAWWRVTLDFLKIVTENWPAFLAECKRMNPAAYRNAVTDAEAKRLRMSGSKGPVIAAGSTGSIPATARLLSEIARLQNGAVVLPGLDKKLDDQSWRLLGADDPDPSTLGHPQFGLCKLTRQISVSRNAVVDLGWLPSADAEKLDARAHIISEAMRPAETTDIWASNGSRVTAALEAGALRDVILVEAGNEREEALAIAVALRKALHEGSKTTALVTGDRALARRVSAELERFGLIADDSAGRPLSNTQPGNLLRILADCVFRPGDPVSCLALIKHPLIRLGFGGRVPREAAEILELVALRSGPVRPDIADFSRVVERQLEALTGKSHAPGWFDRLDEGQVELIRIAAGRFEQTVVPMASVRGTSETSIGELARATAQSLEALCMDDAGDLASLYGSDEGQAIASLLQDLMSASAPMLVKPEEWPEILEAVMAGRVVKPAAGADSRIAIWGTLEARLQTVDTIILGGLNEGSWPATPQADRFMSRQMKTMLGLEPPERRIGLAAHDFVMAMGMPKVVLSRSLRAGEAPSVPSRWLQRLLTVVGETGSKALSSHGNELLEMARALDEAPDKPLVPRPSPTPPVDFRPKRFSFTEVETLRRDPYATYARRILRLEALEPHIADPDARERGTIFHEILHRIISSNMDVTAHDARVRLDAIARTVFQEAQLPDDIIALWWPRYLATADNMLDFERKTQNHAGRQFSESRANPIEVEGTGVYLSGRADRIAILTNGTAEIIDFKTGSTPSKKQAHTLVAPQLPLEGAAMMRGAFDAIGPMSPDDLLYIRLNSDGSMKSDSILKIQGNSATAVELSDKAWRKLDELLQAYNQEDQGYLSRALPFRETDTDGDYDHLARVLEWSAGAGEGGEGE